MSVLPLVDQWRFAISVIRFVFDGLAVVAVDRWIESRSPYCHKDQVEILSLYFKPMLYTSHMNFFTRREHKSIRLNIVFLNQGNKRVIYWWNCPAGVHSVDVSFSSLTRGEYPELQRSYLGAELHLNTFRWLTTLGMFSFALKSAFESTSIARTICKRNTTWTFCWCHFIARSVHRVSSVSDDQLGPGISGVWALM